MLYNGETEQPDKVVLRLSDAFESHSEGFEWTAIMLNINLGHNKEFLNACKSLQDYATYVKLVRDNIKEKKMTVGDAVNKALDDAISQNLLEGFFEIHRAEVLEMCLTEFDQENYDINRREEGYEMGFSAGKRSGMKKGMQKTRLETAKKMLSDGFSTEMVEKYSGVSRKQIHSLQGRMKS